MKQVMLCPVCNGAGRIPVKSPPVTTDTDEYIRALRERDEERVKKYFEKMMFEVMVMNASAPIECDYCRGRRFVAVDPETLHQI